MSSATNFSPEGDNIFSAPEVYSDATANHQGHEASLIREYLGIILRRKWIILGVVAAALLAGIAATLLAVPQYTASSRLEIARQDQRITNVEGVDDVDRTFDQEFYETQYQLLTARSVAERVERELRLATRPEFFEAHGIDINDLPLRESTGQVPTREELDKLRKGAVGLLLGNVSISPIARSSLVDIVYTSASPALSAEIANAWSEQFIAESIDRRFSMTSDAQSFLERRLAELRKDVEDSERKLVTYANQNDIVILNRQEQDGRTVATPTLKAATLEQLNSALVEATAQRVALEARAASPGGSDFAGNTAVANLRNRLADLQAQYAEMMVKFEPGYPAARALAEQIDALETSIAREESRLRGGSRADYQAALKREQDLTARVDALTGQLRDQERARIQYNIFQNEVDTNRELYEGTLQRYREIGVASVGASNIAIVDQAQVPGAPSSPNLMLNLLIALFGGAVAAAVVVFLLEQFDDGIRTPDDVTSATGLPLLGVVPVAEDDEEIADLVDDPKSEVSEAYLTIRSNLALSSTRGVPGVVMITSSRAAEGKSTTSYALARILARTGKRVIIIDADMRSPSVHNAFGMANGQGFANFLAGEDDLALLINHSDMSNLDVMTAGPTPPSAAELLSGDRTGTLISKLRENYDHVVVDAPPLLGIADAPLLSKSVDGVVYVIESRGVPVRGINLSLDRLRDSRANLLGGVLTKFDNASTTGYGYGYGYGYGFRYGQDEEERA
ncbi:GumC family protein [Pseudoblastomonas halimionae]|uniref:non-specific protein-tyrosine kinase n=1 Tax=Alteriqipengyuania halimionae TaxID=1926630 RepID=A0A6I4U460_9SPHN|nr:polysaccharide biosynthesis tyrosine autokinase [Alteriqipengyuania halimionae]MXP10899.1 polysaccharide biosynthesis tyrosine autokinase [Alteriqipengyuania halimionae]